MKIKHGFIGAWSIGLAAALLRAVQYITVIDKEGYYTKGGLSSFLGGMLIGLLAIGVLFCFLAGRKKKVPLTYSELIGGSSVPMVLLGAVSLADGIYRLIFAKVLLPRVVAVLCLLGAIGWIVIGLMGKRAPSILGLLPIIQMGAIIIDYFWNTYKYIQVSEYALTVLALSAACFFVLLIMKALAEADCSKGRLMIGGCLLTILGLPAFPVSLMGGLTASRIFLAAEGVLLLLIAADVLRRLAKPCAPAPKEGPDLSALNEYINNLPEVEEQENEQA